MEKILKKIMRDFPKLMTDAKPRIPESQRK